MSLFDKIRQGISPVKIKRAFDDFLFLLSLFVLPSIVFHKNHEIFATPLWISILSGAAAVVIFIVIIINYTYCHMKDNEGPMRLFFFLSPLVIDLCHILSDICFLFYTRSIPVSNFTDVFIYVHAVTGFLGAIFLLYVTIYLFLDKYCKIVAKKIREIFGKYLIIAY